MEVRARLRASHEEQQAFEAEMSKLRPDGASPPHSSPAAERRPAAARRSLAVR